MMSDFVIHPTAAIIGEADSLLSRTRAVARCIGRLKDARPKGRAMQRAFFRTPYGILDNGDPLAKLAAKR